MRKALFFIFIFLAASLQAAEEWNSNRERPQGSISMSGPVFVVSEWLPKENCEEELWNFLKS
jgi:hypothetical protein